MTVRIENLYGRWVWVLEGKPRQVEAAVLLLFPWLRSSDPADRCDLQGLLEELGSQQAFWVSVEDSDGSSS